MQLQRRVDGFRNGYFLGRSADFPIPGGQGFCKFVDLVKDLPGLGSQTASALQKKFSTPLSERRIRLKCIASHAAAIKKGRWGVTTGPGGEDMNAVMVRGLTALTFLISPDRSFSSRKNGRVDFVPAGTLKIESGSFSPSF